MRPNTSQPVVAIFEQRIEKTYGKIQRRLFENCGRITLARPDQSSTDQPLQCLGVVSSTGGDKSCYGHPAIEDLDLTSTTNFIDVAGQIRLQLRNRRNCH